MGFQEIFIGIHNGISSFQVLSYIIYFEPTNQYHLYSYSKKLSPNSDDQCALNCDGLDQSSEGWLVDCLNESKENSGSKEMSRFTL